jgi:hypothetical protein
MRTSSSCRFIFNAAIRLIIFCVLCELGHAQILNQDQEVEVHLQSLMARTKDPSDVLLTSLDTIFHDKEICCGKDSALIDSVSTVDPQSLKDVSGKLNGRHLLSDGRPIMVKTTYLTPDQVTGGEIISAIMNQHAALMEWNSHLYVVHGVIYMWISNNSPDGGTTAAVIHKLLLWDTRFSDSRRAVVFNRDTDDVSNIQGFLLVDAKPQ